MNTLRRVGLVAVSCIILLLALICPVSATDEPLITRQDFIDLGYLEDEYGLYVPRGGYDPLAYRNFFITTQINNPDFKPNDIPWSEAPQYIQDIISNGFSNVFTLSPTELVPSDYKMPFILVLVRSSDVVVFAGYNLCLGINNLTSSLRVCSTSFFDFPPCYRAVYRLSDMELITPWYQVNSTSWGDTGYVKYYSSSLILEDESGDIYLYGGNSVRPGAVSVTISLLTDNEDALFMGFCNETIGFQNGRYFPLQELFTGLYVDYFKPSFYSDVNTGIVGDFGEAEGNLINSYNPDNLSGDIDLDSALTEDTFGGLYFFALTTSMFLESHPSIISLFVFMLILGFISLILNR